MKLFSVVANRLGSPRVGDCLRKRRRLQLALFRAHVKAFARLPGVPASNALFQWSAAEQRQNEKICQDIDDTSSKNYEAETLRRWKIR